MSMLDSFVHHAESLIRASGALPGADDACLRSIAEAASWLSIRGGETLFAQGDPSDSIYIVINGLLVATVSGAVRSNSDDCAARCRGEERDVVNVSRPLSPKVLQLLVHVGDRTRARRGDMVFGVAASRNSKPSSLQ